jgi:DNA-binding MltR family transcriptional regulator
MITDPITELYTEIELMREFLLELKQDEEARELADEMMYGVHA